LPSPPHRVALGLVEQEFSVGLKHCARKIEGCTPFSNGERVNEGDSLECSQKGSLRKVFLRLALPIFGVYPTIRIPSDFDP
jgi:hypothetical protein